MYIYRTYIQIVFEPLDTSRIISSYTAEPARRFVSSRCMLLLMYIMVVSTSACPTDLLAVTAPNFSFTAPRYLLRCECQNTPFGRCSRNSLRNMRLNV